MYVAADLACAIIETFGRSHSSVVTVSSLSAAGLARIHTSRELKLFDLAESGGLTRIGTDSRLCSIAEYGLTQRWSKALHDHPARADGIFYRSRLDPARFACAVFDRASDAFNAEPLGTLAKTEHAPLISEVLDTYKWSLIAD